MIYLVSNRNNEYLNLNIQDFQLSTFDEFIKWTKLHTVFQLDTETLFIDDGPDVNEDRKLILIQLGDTNMKDQWLIEYTAFLEASAKAFLTSFFSDINNAFIAHNAYFEYITIKANLGIRVENIHDTFLMSKILNTGYELEDGYHSLAGCVKRFFEIELDKGEQTKFTFNLLTEDQIIYAANDVIYLYGLFIKLKELLVSWDLWFLYFRVEREVIKAYADMSLNYMRFDLTHWRSNIGTLEAEDIAFEKELNALVFQDAKLVTYLKNSNTVLGTYLIQPKDQLLLNWGSNIVRNKVLTKLIPDLVSLGKFTKPELNKIYKSGVLTVKENRILKLYLNQNFTLLNRYIRTWHKEWLIQNEFFIEKDSVCINWSSNHHKLYIFQFYYPQLTDTNAKTLSRYYANPIINKFKQYVKVHKNVTTYGEAFIKKYVTRNNTIGPRGCNSILNTGRIAFSILLQLPSKDNYRNAFLPPEEDWVFVDSDYSSAELAIMACIGKEDSLLEVIRNGKDAHMFVAQKLFPEEWQAAAEDGCIQLIDKSKCTCSGHEKLRKSGKTFNFGIP
jgi:hypothetical protein